MFLTAKLSNHCLKINEWESFKGLAQQHKRSIKCFGEQMVAALLLQNFQNRRTPPLPRRGLRHNHSSKLTWSRDWGWGWGVLSLQTFTSSLLGLEPLNLHFPEWTLKLCAETQKRRNRCFLSWSGSMTPTRAPLPPCSNRHLTIVSHVSLNRYLPTQGTQWYSRCRNLYGKTVLQITWTNTLWGFASNDCLAP